MRRLLRSGADAGEQPEELHRREGTSQCDAAEQSEEHHGREGAGQREAAERRERRVRDERGQMTVLIVGFAAIVLLMVVVVTDISKVFLVRRDLDSTADGAVLAAANGLAAIYAQSGSGGNAQIDPEEARRLAADYLDTVSASERFDGLDWSAEVTGTTVTVELTSSVELPFTPPGWQENADIASSASAIVPVR